MRHASIVVAILALGATNAAVADSCIAEADFTHAYPSNDDATKWKIKFKVSSDDCRRYGCSGHIHYRIHYDWKSGGSNSKSTLVGYRIGRGERSREVTDETYPSSAILPLKVRDVEIGEVSCISP